MEGVQRDSTSDGRCAECVGGWIDSSASMPEPESYRLQVASRDEETVDVLGPHKRSQSAKEEVANGLSHGLALIAAMAATPLLLDTASRLGDAWNLLGAGIFAGAILLMYLSSSLYHLLPENRAKRVFRLLDHGAIFVLIAGTYTPFTLGALRGAWGWTLFGLVWGIGLVGMALKLSGTIRHPSVSTGLYLAMGWLIVVAIRPIWANVPLEGILWLLTGGIAYTTGVAFFAAEHLRYNHFIWHLFVILGSVCHFVAVLWYAG